MQVLSKVKSCLEQNKHPGIDRRRDRDDQSPGSRSTGTGHLCVFVCVLYGCARLLWAFVPLALDMCVCVPVPVHVRVCLLWTPFPPVPCVCEREFVCGVHVKMFVGNACVRV